MVPAYLFKIMIPDPIKHGRPYTVITPLLLLYDYDISAIGLGREG